MNHRLVLLISAASGLIAGAVVIYMRSRPSPLGGWEVSVYPVPGQTTPRVLVFEPDGTCRYGSNPCRWQSEFNGVSLTFGSGTSSLKFEGNDELTDNIIDGMTLRRLVPGPRIVK